MIRKALAKLNEKQLKMVKHYQTNRNSGIENLEEEARFGAIGYLTALMDAGVITDRERMALYVFTTVPARK